MGYLPKTVQPPLISIASSKVLAGVDLLCGSEILSGDRLKDPRLERSECFLITFLKLVQHADQHLVRRQLPRRVVDAFECFIRGVDALRVLALICSLMKHAALDSLVYAQPLGENDPGEAGYLISP